MVHLLFITNLYHFIFYLNFYKIFNHLFLYFSVYMVIFQKYVPPLLHANPTSLSHSPQQPAQL